MKDKLETMPDAEFASHRSGLEKKWLEADKNLLEETARYGVEVNSGHLDFLRSMKPVWMLVLILTKPRLDDKDAAMRRTITKSDVLDLFMSKVHLNSTWSISLEGQLPH